MANLFRGYIAALCCFLAVLGGVLVTNWSRIACSVAPPLFRHRGGSREPVDPRPWRPCLSFIYGIKNANRRKSFHLPIPHATPRVRSAAFPRARVRGPDDRTNAVALNSFLLPRGCRVALCHRLIVLEKKCVGTGFRDTRQRLIRRLKGRRVDNRGGRRGDFCNGVSRDAIRGCR